MDDSLNVFGEALVSCAHDPVTGFFRDGCCNTSRADVGSHTVCVELTTDFLAYSKAQGNDLSTPKPEWDFPGLRAGNRWCLCAARWLEAYEAGAAPKVYLGGTHQQALALIPLSVLRRFAVDLN